MMGLGGALFEQVDFADGKILNPSFSDYRLPRFRDAPQLKTVLLSRFLTIKDRLLDTFDLHNRTEPTGT